MTWTRLSDNFTDRPELLEVSRSARLLHVEALVYCNKHLRDGRLPFGALRRITDAEDPALDAKLLVDAGIWQEGDASWLIDWTDQEMAEEVQARHDYRAETQKRYRDRKSRHGRGDHSMCDSRYCANASRHESSNATSNESSNESSNELAHETPSPPGPSRPGPKGQGQGQEASAPESAGADPDASHSETTRRYPFPPHAWGTSPSTGEPVPAGRTCCELLPHHPMHNTHERNST